MSGISGILFLGFDAIAVIVITMRVCNQRGVRVYALKSPVS